MNCSSFRASVVLGLFFSSSVIAHKFSCPDPQKLEFRNFDSGTRWEAVSDQYPLNFPDLFKREAYYEAMAIPDVTDSPYLVEDLKFHSATYSREHELSYKCRYTYIKGRHSYQVVLDLGSLTLSDAKHQPLIVIPHGAAWRWDEKSDRRKEYVCLKSPDECQFEIPKLGFSYSVSRVGTDKPTPEYAIGYRWDDDDAASPFDRSRWLFQQSADKAVTLYKHVEKVPEDMSGIRLIYSQPKEKEGEELSLYYEMASSGSESIKDKTCDTEQELSSCDCSPKNLLTALEAPGHTQVFIESHYDTDTESPGFRCVLYYVSDKHCQNHHDADHQGEHDHHEGL